MDLYILKYNNYYNRIVKFENTLAGYLPYQVGDVIQDVNFKPNDGVNTTQIVNKDYTHIGDYLLAVEDNQIVSRWFVMETQSIINSAQYRLTLRRDLIVDNYNSIINAPCFIEKATLNTTDPLIFNSEDMTFNQIKTSETLLKDKSNSAWIVGYVSRNAKTDSPININYTPEVDITVNSLSDYEYYTYSTNSFTTNSNPIYNILMGTGYIVHNKEECVKYSFNAYGPQNVNIDDDTYSQGSMSYGSGIRNYPGEPDPYKTPTWYTKYVNQSSKLKLNVNPSSENLNLIKSYFDFKSLADSIALSENIHSFTETNDFLAENGKIIHDNTTNKNYRVKISQTNGNLSTVAATYQSTGALYEKIKGYLNNARADYPTMFNGEIGDATISIQFINQYYKIEFVEVTSISGSLTISEQRDHLTDAPYDMFCIPYTDNTKIYSNGVIQYTASSDAAIAVSQALSNIWTGTNLYDIQLLPYCPKIEFIQADGSIDVGDSSVSWVKDSSNVIQCGLFWCHKSTDSFYLPLAEPITITEPKIQNQCDMYRLVSPNYNGQFQFNAAKNNGVSRFRVDFTYLPYNPYIRVAPDFGGLYGGEFNDARGLICGGDFSLPQSSSAFEKYKVENKNYLNIFDRQIDNLEINNSVSRMQQKAQIMANTISATAMGTMAGSSMARTTGGKVALGTAGGVTAGLASAAAGALDLAASDYLRAETLDYKRDMFGMQLGNIEAMPNSLAKTTSFNASNKIFPILEYYTCTDTEKQAFRNKLKYNGMTVGRIGTISEFLRADKTYIKGKIIRIEDLHEDFNYLNEIGLEMDKGVFI